MVDFSGRCRTGGNQPVGREGLAREGNLDILMPWGMPLTYSWIDIAGVGLWWQIVDFGGPSQSGENELTALLGLAREGNLDILMS